MIDPKERQLDAAVQDALLRRWVALARELNLTGNIQESGQYVLELYSQPHRRYHNLRHLQYCLETLDQVKDHVKDLPAAEAALWFHDAIYEVGSRDNELKSAAMAREVLTALGMVPSARIERVAHLILATSHSGEAKTDDAKILCDIDLSILGQPEDVYRQYSSAIRAEAQLDDKTYSDRRMCFLEQMLSSPTVRSGKRGVFNTDLFQSRFGFQAYRNIRRELEELRGSAPELECSLIEVRQRIAGLYSTFGRHGIGESILTDDRAITSGPLLGPLDHIVPGDIARYATKAMTTQGSVEDFKHFLPRLFELLVVEGDYLDPEVLVGKLTYGEWATWPVEEQQAVLEFLRAWWRAVLSHFPENLATIGDYNAWERAAEPRLNISADDCLCAIAQACDDLHPFLDDWTQGRKAAALRHLAAFIADNVASLREERGLKNTFWGNGPGGAEQVVRWLMRSEFVEQIRTTAKEITDLTAALELDQAADSLEAILTSSKGRTARGPSEANE